MQRFLSFVSSLVTLTLGLTACKHPCMDIMPNRLYFVLLDKQGQNLLTNVQAPLKMYTYDLTGKTSDIDLNSPKAIFESDFPESLPSKCAFASGYPAGLSASGTKEFYLELNGKTDTLHYDVQRIAGLQSCTDRYEVAAITFNGKPVMPHSLGGTEAYYVLQRAH